VHYLGKSSHLSNFPARNFGAAVAALRPGVAEFANSRSFFNRAKPILDCTKPLLAE